MYELKVDGTVYDVHIVAIKRSADVLDGPNSGRSTNAVMVRDILGTFYNYSVEIDSDALTAEEYDALYEALTAPEDYHTIEMPYGQTIKRFRAYVSKVDDELIQINGQYQRWGNMSFQFVAIEPQRR